MDAVLNASTVDGLLPGLPQIESSFLTLCVDTANTITTPLSREEITRMHDNGLIVSVLEYIWQYTGHFYRWPEQLLKRQDLTDATREELTVNLEDELGINGTLPHNQLFWNFAASLGVKLPKDQAPGHYLKEILNNASALSAPAAIGQLLANEATPKWAGFSEVFENVSGVDLEFFEVHKNDVNHYQHLCHGFMLDDMPELLDGVVKFSHMQARYINGIRALSSH